MVKLFRVIHIPTGRYYCQSFNFEEAWLKYFEQEVSRLHKISVVDNKYGNVNDLMFTFNEPNLMSTRLEHFEPMEIDSV